MIPRLRALGAALPLAAAALLQAALGRAEELRVAVLAEADSAVARRAAAESRAIGFDVVRLRPDRTEPNLAIAAKGASAVAVIHIVSEDALELFVPATADAPAASETLMADEFTTPLALNAVERMRARLIAIGLVEDEAHRDGGDALEEPSTRRDASTSKRSAARSGPPARPARSTETGGSAVADAAAPTRRADDGVRLGVEVGVAALLPAGGLGSSLGALVAPRLQVARWTGSVFVGAPLTESSVSRERASASVSVWIGGARGARRFFADSAVAPEIGAGVAIVAVRMDASADPPLAARDETVFAGVGFVDAALVLQLGGVDVRLLAACGLTAPRPTVAFEGDAVAHWGRLFGMGGLSVDLPLARWLGQDASRERR